MKKLVWVCSLISIFLGMGLNAQELSPYFKVASLNQDVETVSAELNKVISENGWDVIGKYHPEGKTDLTVICFTSEELKKLSLEFEDRGTLASVLKAAIVMRNDTAFVSILNPEYMFLAYWGEQLDGQEKQLKAISEKAKSTFSVYGNMEPFGGSVEVDDLPDYRYMMMMPYFRDPVVLNNFNSFEEGLKIIRENLEVRKAKTVKVYEQLFDGKEVAVFGIGMMDAEEGEEYFLPIIGEENIANLPYEIILQGKEATMLHGKYRIAIFWPELKMGQFMKISSTPGDIEDTFEVIAGGDED